MVELGLADERVGRDPMLGMSKFLSALVVINMLTFGIAYSIRVGVLDAAFIAVSSYVATLGILALLRGTAYDSLLKPLHKAGWFAMPLASALLWILGFDGRPRSLEACLETYALPAHLPRAVSLAQLGCQRAMRADVRGTELAREMCLLKGIVTARDVTGLGLIRSHCASSHPPDEDERQRVAERIWSKMSVCPRTDPNLYVEASEIRLARPTWPSDSFTRCGFKSYGSIEQFRNRAGIMLAPPPGYVFNNDCAIECKRP